MENLKQEILYVGGFILPDKNAAAQRVIGIAKILKIIGYNITFFNKIPGNGTEIAKKDYFGFDTYEYHKDNSKISLLKDLSNIDYIKEYLKTRKNIFAIIAYNFPAIGLWKLKKLCKEKGIYCIADITEWYGTKNKSLLYKIFKGFDTWLRMRFIHKKLNGNIVISDYLDNYYKKFLPTVKIPPVVDREDAKWNYVHEAHNEIRFIYAGNPSAEKERLDLIVEAFMQLKKAFNVKFYVIGITKKQFEEIYKISNSLDDSAIIFLGKIEHQEVLRHLSNCDYSVLIRDENRVTKAGFPTKFVESISCGIPVITNNNSSVKNYISKNQNGFIVDKNNLVAEISSILQKKEIIKVDSYIFDLKNYTEFMASFMEKLI